MNSFGPNAGYILKLGSSSTGQTPAGRGLVGLCQQYLQSVASTSYFMSDF